MEGAEERSPFSANDYAWTSSYRGPGRLQDLISLVPPVLPPQPHAVGGILQNYWHVWEQMNLDPWAVSVIRDGFLIRFHSQPPLATYPLIRSGSNTSRLAPLRDQISKLLDKGAIEPVTNPQAPSYYSRLFLAPKGPDDWRPVIDLSSLNKLIVIPKFKMDTPAFIRQNLKLGSWVYRLDLKDAYLQVPMHRASRKFLRFEFLGEVYQFRVLPFGISSAPWLFTKLVKVVKDLFHRRGMHLFQYLDDWLGDAPDPAEAESRAQALVQLCHTLGFVINPEKSDLVPSQTFDFVGMHIDLRLGIVSVTEKNSLKLLSAVSDVIQSPAPTARMWLKLIGTITSQETRIHHGKRFKRHIQWHLKDHWTQAVDSLDAVVPTSSHILPHLLWWTEPNNFRQGVPLHWPQFTVRLFTDASSVGWGAQWKDRQAQGSWSPEEAKLHINVLELRAVRLALAHFQFSDTDSILIATDNLTVVSYINHQGGTRSRSLWLETELLLQEFDRLNLRARHIPGKLNVIADQLSRMGQILPSEWTLHEDVVREIFDLWGNPTLDLFATRFNSRCPTFVSPVPDERAWEVDALSISWENLWAYAFPPVKILGKVLEKFNLTKVCSLILIAPKWPKQLWYPSLLNLSSVDPIPLPNMEKLLAQPRSDVFHQNPSQLHLHAWLLRKTSS